MIQPLYYLKDAQGNEVGVVLDSDSYRRLVKAAGELQILPSQGRKPKGSANAPTVRGMSVADVVVEERR